MGVVGRSVSVLYKKTYPVRLVIFLNNASNEIFFTERVTEIVCAEAILANRKYNAAIKNNLKIPGNILLTEKPIDVVYSRQYTEHITLIQKYILLILLKKHQRLLTWKAELFIPLKVIRFLLPLLLRRVVLAHY